MEILIVVAIIAVLVAIAIPGLNNALEKARESTDAANIRSGYAELMTIYLVEERNPANNDVWKANNGTWTFEYKEKQLSVIIPLTQKQAGWQNDKIITIGGMSAGNPIAGGKAVITINPAGGTTLEYKAA